MNFQELINQIQKVQINIKLWSDQEKIMALLILILITNISTILGVMIIMLITYMAKEVVYDELRQYR